MVLNDPVKDFCPKLFKSRLWWEPVSDRAILQRAKGLQCFGKMRCGSLVQVVFLSKPNMLAEFNAIALSPGSLILFQ